MRERGRQKTELEEGGLLINARAQSALGDDGAGRTTRKNTGHSEGQDGREG